MKKGSHHTLESKERIRQARLGKPIHSEERKRIISEQHKGKVVSSETRKKISIALKKLPKLYGPESHHWKGGTSFGKYCWRFNKPMKKEIKEKFNYKCAICETEDNNCKQGLYIHHIDYNSLQGCFGKKWALVPLCGPCHNITKWYKHYSFNLLINYWVFNSEIDFNNYILFVQSKPYKERNHLGE